ncbi:OCEL1 protein, partial [Alectura lathami]|nr:OCEL1 protein [Alectura lathami]
TACSGLMPPSPFCTLKPPPARAKRVIFQDELGTPGRPPGTSSATIALTEEGKKPGGTSGCSVPPGLVPRPHAVPDYVVKYPAIRSGRQRQEYGAVFADQLAEYRELLGELRAAQRGLEARQPCSTDSAFLAKHRRCLYLKEKLTHIKAQIQEYDRSACSSAAYF